MKPIAQEEHKAKSNSYTRQPKPKEAKSAKADKLSLSSRRTPPLPPPLLTNNESDDLYVIPNYLPTDDDSIYEEICTTLPVCVGTKTMKPLPIACKTNQPLSPSDQDEYVDMIPTDSLPQHVSAFPESEYLDMSGSDNSRNLDHISSEDTYEEVDTCLHTEKFDEKMNISKPHMSTSLPQAASSNYFHSQSEQIDEASHEPEEELYEDTIVPPLTTKPPLASTERWHSLPIPPRPPKGQEFTQNYNNSDQECIYDTIPDVLN